MVVVERPRRTRNARSRLRGCPVADGTVRADLAGPRWRHHDTCDFVRVRPRRVHVGIRVSSEVLGTRSPGAARTLQGADVHVRDVSWRTVVTEVTGTAGHRSRVHKLPPLASNASDRASCDRVSRWVGCPPLALVAAIGFLRLQKYSCFQVSVTITDHFLVHGPRHVVVFRTRIAARRRMQR